MAQHAISEFLKCFPCTKDIFGCFETYCEVFIQKRPEHNLKTLRFMSLRYSANLRRPRFVKTLQLIQMSTIGIKFYCMTRPFSLRSTSSRSASLKPPTRIVKARCTCLQGNGCMLLKLTRNSFLEVPRYTNSND